MTATTTVSDSNQSPAVFIRVAQPEDDTLYGDEIYRIVNTAYRSG